MLKNYFFIVYFFEKSIQDLVIVTCYLNDFIYFLSMTFFSQILRIHFWSLDL